MNEDTDLFQITEAWQTAFPGAHAGVLALDQVENPPRHPALEEQKAALQARLRSTHGGQDRADLKALPAMRAYDAYYRQFKKTYHVLLQLESVASGHRQIPSVSPLVEVMFMAELENLILTAAHDLDQIEPPVALRVAAGNETYVQLNGKKARLKGGDMFMADRRGVISSILYGPDQRTKVGRKTERVLYTAYVPTGIPRDAVEAHLGTLLRFARLCSPGAQVLLQHVFPRTG